MPAGRPTKYEERYCDEVVDFMAQGFSLTAFCGKIGIARSTINVWMENNPTFSEAVMRAKAECLLKWEMRAMRIADDGGDGVQGTLTIFALKNMGGDEWRDKQEMEHSGKVGWEQVVHESIKK